MGYWYRPCISHPCPEFPETGPLEIQEPACRTGSEWKCRGGANLLSFSFYFDPFPHRWTTSAVRRDSALFQRNERGSRWSSSALLILHEQAPFCNAVGVADEGH